MSERKKPQLIFPISGQNVRDSLFIARPDLIAFRKTELAWISKNNPRFELHVLNMFEANIKAHGPTHAEATMAGNLMAHHAISHSVDSRGWYESVADNYWHNVYSDRAIQKQLATPYAQMTHYYGVEENVRRSIPDEDLADSLMEIASDDARDAATILIMFFCLDRMPAPEE